MGGYAQQKNANDSKRKIAEEVREWIDEIENFEMFLLDVVGHGYSCQEIEWHRLGHIWLPKAISYILPRNFMTP